MKATDGTGIAIPQAIVKCTPVEQILKSGDTHFDESHWNQNRDIREIPTKIPHQMGGILGRTSLYQAHSGEFLNPNVVRNKRYFSNFIQLDQC